MRRIGEIEPVYRVSPADHGVGSATEHFSVNPGMHPCTWAADQDAGRGQLFTRLGLMKMKSCLSPRIALAQSHLNHEGGYY